MELPGRGGHRDQGREPADIRRKLADLGGTTAQELGLGRVVGQVLIYLYLTPDDCPMDRMEEDLHLSKAAISIATRHLEHLGLIRRVLVPGERRKFYRTADNIDSALQQGVMSIVRRKLEATGEALDDALAAIDAGGRAGDETEAAFLAARIRRARLLRNRFARLLNHPVLRLLIR